MEQAFLDQAEWPPLSRCVGYNPKAADVYALGNTLFELVTGTTLIPYQFCSTPESVKICIHMCTNIAVRERF